MNNFKILFRIPSTRYFQLNFVVVVVVVPTIVQNFQPPVTVRALYLSLPPLATPQIEIMPVARGIQGKNRVAKMQTLSRANFGNLK